MFVVPENPKIYWVLEELYRFNTIYFEVKYARRGRQHIIMNL